MTSTSPPWLALLLADQDRHHTVFSPEELVVLALCSNLQGQMTKKDIGRWIIEYVPHYQILAADAYFSENTHTSAGSLNALDSSICQYLRKYDIPVHKETHGKNGSVYWVTAGAAYSVLKHHIVSVGFDAVVKPVASTFPFLKLPIELRLKIYSMVLAAPGLRLKVESACFVGFDDRIPIYGTSARHDLIAMPCRSKILALLSVNKQISREATPEFYKQNHFHFPNLSILGGFLAGIGPARRKYLRNITLSYITLTTAPRATSLLLESDMLQRLTLLVDIKVDPKSGHLIVYSSKRKYKKVDTIPGLKNLQKLRGLRELEFAPFWEYGRVRDFLKPFVFLPRGAEGPVTTTRKRGPAKRRRLDIESTATDGKETEDQRPISKTNSKKKARLT